MYDAVDKKAISPGIKVVDDVSTSGGSEDSLFEKHKQALKAYRLKAEEDVKDVVQAVNTNPALHWPSLWSDSLPISETKRYHEFVDSSRAKYRELTRSTP